MIMKIDRSKNLNRRKIKNIQKMDWIDRTTYYQKQKKTAKT